MLPERMTVARQDLPFVLTGRPISDQAPRGLFPGEQIMSAPHNRRQHFLSELRAMEKRGEVQRLHEPQDVWIPHARTGALHLDVVCVVARLKPRRRLWPFYAAGALGGFAYAITVAWTLWELRYAIGALAIAVLLLAGVLHGFKHNLSCPGRLVHCSGCRG